MKWTSPMGRKIVPLLAAFALGVVVASVVFEARAWTYWHHETAAELAAYEADTRATVEAGQKAARIAARNELKPKGPAGFAPVYPPPTRESMQPPKAALMGQ